MGTGACVECLDIEEYTPLERNMWVAVKTVRDLQNTENEVQYISEVGVIVKKYTKPDVQEESEAPKFKVSDKVEANYKGRGRYNPGKISTLDVLSRTAKIKYDDGDVETAVPFDRIRKRGNHSIDDEEENQSSLYDVLLYDGQMRTGLPRATIFAAIVDLHTHIEKERGGGIKFAAGDRVEARYEDSQWYSGRIEKAHNDDNYDIEYDDGEKEANVSRDLIRVDTTRRNPAQHNSFRLFTSAKTKKTVGLAMFSSNIFIWSFQKSKLFARSLTKPLTQNDRVVYAKMKPDHISFIKDEIEAQVSELKDGQRCLAQFDGVGDFYPGRIAYINSDGTYRVNFDDGDVQRHAHISSIKELDRVEETTGSVSLISFPGGNTVKVKREEVAPYISRATTSLMDSFSMIKYRHGIVDFVGLDINQRTSIEVRRTIR